MRQMLLLCAVFVLCAPSVSQAAMLYLDPPRETLQQGDATILSVRLDVDRASGICVNTADVTVTYPESVQAVDVTTRHSIFPLWVERPEIDTERNRVTFAGGIPNGYCGRIEGDPGLTNVLAEIVFRPAQPTGDPADDHSFVVADIEIDPQSVLLLNDGLGTVINPDRQGATIDVFATEGAQLRDPWREIVQADTTPPEPFSIQLDRDPNVFRGDYFITFNTTDKQSGIATFEVMEEPLSEQHYFRFGAVGAPWVEAQSPYRLKDQTLNSTIRVRATDKAGNEYIATLVPDPSLRTRVIQPHEWISMFAGGVLFLGGLLWLYYRRVRQTAPETRSANDSSL